MDKNPLITKGLALAIVVLFIGTNLIPGSGGDVEQKSEITQVNEPRSAPSSSTDWWPMFHHDLYHSGHSNSTAPETNTVLWTYTTDYWLESSPVVADGKVYIGSQDDKVYCLDALTGAKIWTFHTGHLIVCSPAVYDGKVYIGSTDHLVYCLNADSGSYIWIYPTGWGIAQSSPVVVNGKVYIGSQDNKMYCLDAETGSKIWDYTTGDWISSSPAVADGKVYFGSWDKKIYCLNADNGSKIWDYSTGDIIWTSSPTIFSGKVYIGSLDCIVYCLNATTGMKLWNFTTGDWVTCTPAVANGEVFVSSWDGKIYCLNATTGMMIWYYQTGGGVSSSPAVADRKVYVGSHDNKMYCLDAMTGTKIWDYIAGGQILSSPAIAEGKVYVGSMDNKVYCFGQSNQPPYVTNLSGPTYGQTGIKNHFTAKVVDPDNDNVYYTWDWGDGNISGGIGPYASGDTIYTSHIYVAEGKYEIRVKLKDEHGLEGNWSDPFVITIVQPLRKEFIFGRFTNMIRKGDYITVDAVNLRLIFSVPPFQPFQYLHYTNGEKITFSKSKSHALIALGYIIGIVDVAI